MIAFRDNLAKLRGLAGEKGYRLEKAPIGESWFLVIKETSSCSPRNPVKGVDHD